MKKTIVIIVIIILIVLGAAGGWIYLNKPNSSSKTTPATNNPVPIELSYVDKSLAGMSLSQKVAGLLILHELGTNATTLQKYLKKYQLGGLIFMGDNIPPTLGQLSSLTEKLQIDPQLPYLFAIDEEGGVVARLATDNFPAPADLKSEPVTATEIAFRSRSVMLKNVGMNLNFGIVADVTSDPNSFIYQRVFGGDPTAVSERVAAAVTGANGLTLSTLKHFPGHGETEADSHTSIPTTDVSFARWQQHDEPSFVAGIKAGAQVVMFGQLTYSKVDSLPATLSTKWHDILKQDGFTGISITDDMIMLQQSGNPKYTDPIANSVAALKAGNTMLLFVLSHDSTVSDINPSTLINGIVTAVKKGKLSQAIIDSDIRQVLTLRYSLPTTLTKN